MANSVGVIDKSYRGELKAPVWSMTGKSEVTAGDRLFQIVAPDMGWIRDGALSPEYVELCQQVQKEQQEEKAMEARINALRASAQTSIVSDYRS